MMYEQQRLQQPTIKMKKTEKSKGIEEEEERLEIVDLSGMSLDSLPNPSLNLAIICKLDLSNNNLQVNIKPINFPNINHNNIIGINY